MDAFVFNIGRLLYRNKFKPLVVSASRMSPAALDAGGGFAKGFYAGELGAARGAFVKVASDGGAAREREVVCAFLVVEAEVAAGFFPFSAMGRDAAFADAFLGE